MLIDLIDNKNVKFWSARPTTGSLDRNRPDPKKQWDGFILVVTSKQDESFHIKGDNLDDMAIDAIALIEEYQAKNNTYTPTIPVPTTKKKRST